VSNHLSIWGTNQSPAAILQNPIINEIGTRPRIVGDKLKRLVLIGRLSAEKQPELAIKIAQITCLRLVVIGDGELRTDLEEWTNQESIRVTFTGRLRTPWAEVEPGDLLIVTSSFEGDGLVIVEAMQLGVPILVLDILDLRKFGFPEKNYAKDQLDFVEKINFFSEDLMELLIPEDITSAILASRSLATIGDDWEKLLNSIQLRGTSIH
jgi:glycosyltransferase involved in cell wall biosynthesis